MPTSRQATVLHAVLLVVAALLVVRIRTLPLALAAVEPDIRPELQYTGEDGRQYVYLGDYDSYLWIRHARNYLRTGTTCDAIVDDECRDTYAHAPLGRRMRYPRSLHIAAIVALNRVITLFHPGYPLPATSFWVPVVVSVLGVVPAFLLGLRLGGPLGGLAGAVLINVDPFFLRRTIGSDNDVWNVVLPLWMVWAATEAVATPDRTRRVAWMLVAVVFTALHAAVWRGWIFAAGVVGIGIAADAILVAARRRAVDRATLLDVALVLALFAAGATAAAWTGGTEEAAQGATVAGSIWPNTFETVAELTHRSLNEMAALSLGPAYFVLAVVGALLVAVGIRTTDAPGRAGLVVLVWLVAAFARASAVRFLLLLVAPVGLLAGVALGRVYGALHALLARRLAGTALLAVTAAAFALVAAVAVPAVRGGTKVARDYVPRMDDAWWDTFVHLRDTTPADAIIDTWWDYGHWAKYIAERRVTMDGASLRTHLPYWLARALYAPSEREALGLLRMLNCGSDATPEPEGHAGAWGKLVDRGVEPRAAQAMVLALASLDRAEASAYLTAHGLAPDAVEDVLRSTHCTSPPSYLVLGEDFARLVGWRRLGTWDFARGAGTDTGYLWPQWRPCEAWTDGVTWQCRIGRPVDASGRVLLGLLYRTDSVMLTQAIFQRPGGTPGRADQTGTPGLLLVAGVDTIDEIPFPNPTDPGLGFLIDTVGRRVLAGPPALLRSTFTRLVFLGPKHSLYFTRVDDRVGKWGERVVAWRIEPAS